jgi:hypothetical protein
VEIGFTLTRNGPQIYCWTTKRKIAGKANLQVERTGIRTVYRAAVPWKLLGGPPKPGDTRGFSLLVNDNDGTGRKGWAPLFDGIGWRKVPRDFGKLFF